MQQNTILQTCTDISVSAENYPLVVWLSISSAAMRGGHHFGTARQQLLNHVDRKQAQQNAILMLSTSQRNTA